MRGEVLWAMARRCRASDAGAALDEFPVVAVGMRGKGLWGAARRRRARIGSAGRRAGGGAFESQLARTVSLSVLCVNTKGKSSFCRQPARGCGQGALVSGRVGPIVDGRWGPWALSPALVCCYFKAVGLSRDRTRALMWSDSAGRSSHRLSRGEIRRAAWDRGSGVAVTGHGARGGSYLIPALVCSEDLG